MKLSKWFVSLFIVFILAACAPVETTPSATATVTLPPPTPTPIPTSLVVCLGETPNTLYPYGSPNQAAQQVLQAIYDGPVDHRKYEYQSVLLDALPDLAAGTAILQSAQVLPGDRVINNQGEITNLDFGTFIRPSGCFSSDCAIPFDGTQIVMDQMVGLFTLRGGLTWSDGTPLTTNDSVYAFHLNGNPDLTSPKYKFDRTLAYEALDPQTIKWTGIPGFIDPTYQDNFWLPAPQHQWGEQAPAELLTAENASTQPLGFGPFMVNSWQEDQIILHRNPAYHRASEGLPLVDQLVFQVIGLDAQTNLDMLESGECDVLDKTASEPIDAQSIQQYQTNGKLTAHWTNGKGWAVLYLGIVPQSYDDGYSMWASDRADFFSDVRVRQAIAMCINREELAKTATLSDNALLHSFIPSSHPLYYADAPTYAYDPEAGADLLTEAGWGITDAEGIRLSSGIPDMFDNTRFELRYRYPAHPQNEIVAQQIKADLKTCGIELNVKSLTAEELFATDAEAHFFGRNFDLVQFSWQASEAPPCHLFLSEAIPGEDKDTHLYSWGGWNATGWSNEAYDTACKQTRGSAPGQESYLPGHATTQQLFAEQLPVIPLFMYQSAVLHRPEICGVTNDPTAGVFWNAEMLASGNLCP